MNDSLRLSAPDLTDPAAAAQFFRIADAARQADGYDPFNEQSRLDVSSGRRSPIVATAGSEVEHPRAVGAAILGHGELDFVIDPVFRRKGFGGVALNQLLPTAPGELTAWSHGDHPAARVLAKRHGFDVVRTLLQLRAELGPVAREAGPSAQDIRIDGFRPGLDDEEWVALNAAVFASHPEQGAVTVDDLHERMAEPWFDAGDFLIARDESGSMLGYNWLKIEPGEHRTHAAQPAPQEGEIYVIGVAAASAGHGLGRRLMTAGLARLCDRGCTAATLYVEADNAPAVRLYRSLGFVDHTVDVQYRRR